MQQILKRTFPDASKRRIKTNLQKKQALNVSPTKHIYTFSDQAIEHPPHSQNNFGPHQAKHSTICATQTTGERINNLSSLKIPEPSLFPITDTQQGKFTEIS